MKSAILCALTLAIALVLSGCSQGPTKISIINNSSVTVSNATLTSGNFTIPLDTMDPGMVKTLTKKTPLKTGVWITCEAGGKKYDSRGPSGTFYFQPKSGAILGIAITPNLSIIETNSDSIH